MGRNTQRQGGNKKTGGQNRKKSGPKVRLSREQRAILSHKAELDAAPKLNGELVSFLTTRKCTTVRAVWTNEDGKSDSTVLPLREAYDKAKGKGVDLTLVTPVSKLDGSRETIVKILDFAESERERRRKERETKDLPKTGKQKAVKEYKFGGSIGGNDRDRLVNRGIESLMKGHQVKVTLIAKRRELNLNPTCLSDLNDYIGHALEGYGGVNEGKRPVRDGETRYNVVFTPKQNAKGTGEKMIMEKGRLWIPKDEE